MEKAKVSRLDKIQAEYKKQWLQYVKLKILNKQASIAEERPTDGRSFRYLLTGGGFLFKLEANRLFTI